MRRILCAGGAARNTDGHGLIRTDRDEDSGACLSVSCPCLSVIVRAPCYTTATSQKNFGGHTAVRFALGAAVFQGGGGLDLEQSRWTVAGGWEPHPPGKLRDVQLALVFGGPEALKESSLRDVIGAAYP